MLEKIPSPQELSALMGAERFRAWTALCEKIDALYEMEHLWNSGGKSWKYEYKYRRGGKTLCALYAREGCFGFLIIFGKDERARIEADLASYSDVVRRVYEEATTYHDGKWVMFDGMDTALFEEYMKLLSIKRKPNRK